MECVRNFHKSIEESCDYLDNLNSIVSDLDKIGLTVVAGNIRGIVSRLGAEITKCNYAFDELFQDGINENKNRSDALFSLMDKYLVSKKGG